MPRRTFRFFDLLADDPIFLLLPTPPLPTSSNFLFHLVFPAERPCGDSAPRGRSAGAYKRSPSRDPFPDPCFLFGFFFVGFFFFF